MLDEVIFYVPNTFTPDADHVNEIFKPTFSSGYNPYTYSLKIFNRWGELVFESFDVDVGWDGTFNTRNAVRVIDGTYIWTIEFKEMLTDKVHTYSGHVNVLK
ncbi:MAG: gliding motility-associated C-terminal domain-containing protein [Brumimicrobium sp.]